MADAAKEAVDKAVEGVKNLAVGSKDKAKDQKDAKPQKEKKKKAGEASDGRPLEVSPRPEFLDHRIKIL